MSAFSPNRRILLAVLLFAGIAGIAARPALAAPRYHTTATLGQYFPVPGVKADCSKTVSDAKKEIGTAYVKAHEEEGNNYILKWWPTGLGYYGSGHAHRHGNGVCVAADAQGDAVNFLPGPLPVPGEPGIAMVAGQTYAPGESPGTTDVTFDPAAFIQLDLTGLAAGVSISASWTLQINREESEVNLVATRLSPEPTRATDTVSVVPTVTGRFANQPYTVTPFPGQIYVLKFAGPLRWTVPGNPDDLDIGVDTQTCSSDLPCLPVPVPALTNWGLVALVLLVVATAMTLLSRRGKMVA